MAFRAYKKASRADWGKTDDSVSQPEDVAMTLEQVQTGAILRIADSVEAMATNHVKLQKDYDYMRDSRDSYRYLSESKDNQIRSLKGIITKLKNKLKKQNNENF